MSESEFTITFVCYWYTILQYNAVIGMHKSSRRPDSCQHFTPKDCHLVAIYSIKVRQTLFSCAWSFYTRCWRLHGIINIIFWFTDYPIFWLLVFAFAVRYNNLHAHKHQNISNPRTTIHFFSEWRLYIAIRF